MFAQGAFVVLAKVLLQFWVHSLMQFWLRHSKAHPYPEEKSSSLLELAAAQWSWGNRGVHIVCINITESCLFCVLILAELQRHQPRTSPQPANFSRLWESFRVALPHAFPVTFLTKHPLLDTYLGGKILLFSSGTASPYIYTLMNCLDDYEKRWKLVFLCSHCVDIAAKR